MSAQTNAPCVIKKVKKVQAAGHHGGAWKVAYADFVTAMMAFFMLMWLLNATTEKQRKGLADYFSPTIPITRTSGGGNGAFGGDSVFAEETLAHTGTGGVPNPAVAQSPDGASGQAGDDAAGAQAEQKKLEELEEVLTGNSGESMVSDLARRHIVTELSDEGLVIELFDVEGEPLFQPRAAEPTPLLQDLLAMIAQVIELTKNGVAIGGHVAAQPVVVTKNTSWSLSGERASKVRELLESQGLPPERIRRVTGYADRKPVARTPMAVRNNRIEIVLLRDRR
ncbi:MAG TPA: chemotaxis protein MotB [Rhodobacterales bacterium]|nr:chemotaxis protein MotB [Rhodobacterales bacterium]